MNKIDVNCKINTIESNINEIKTKINMTEIKVDTQETKMETYVTVDETRDAIKELRNDFSKNLYEIRENVTLLDKKKANVDSTIEALSLKADADLVEKILHSKALKEEVNKIKEDVKELTDNRVERENYDLTLKKINSNLEDINKELSLKSNIKDVCKLMDLKANLK